MGPLFVGPLLEKNDVCPLLGCPLFVCPLLLENEVGPLFVGPLFVCPLLLENEVGPLFVGPLFVCPLLLENDGNPLLENGDPLFEDDPKKPSYKHRHSVIGYYCIGGPRVGVKRSAAQPSGSNFFHLHAMFGKMAKIVDSDHH